ncbi:MAG: DUF4172 domain-containing protein [Kiritimatiellia bacterium]
MSFNWQQSGWPKATVNKAALREELKAFEAAFKALKKALAKSQDLEVVAYALTDEAVKTSAIEGVNVDESVVMSSICKALGVAYAPKGFTKDARAEGVAQMMLAVREKWNSPLTVKLLTDFHAALMKGEQTRVTVGAFRSHKEPMRVIHRLADGTVEIRYEAPPGEHVPKEMSMFVKMWKSPAVKPAEIALKAALLHPHFESIHPFEDGNGRVGRALVSKTIAEGLGLPLILPVSTIIARHRTAYYDEINDASRTLDWTNWAAFFIPVLTEMMTSFVEAMRFVKAKHDYLAKFESSFSERARKVILRMFEDGETGARAGLSAAKWMRMAKVSKPTATRDLAELFAQGAIVPEALGGPETRYRLACVLNEPIEGIKEGINAQLVRLISRHPGVRIPYLKSVVGASTSTVERAIAALVKAGRIEHRGSKKTGGYFTVEVAR